MSTDNWLDDVPALDDGKTNLNSVPAGLGNQYVSAAEWDLVAQALTDMRNSWQEFAVHIPGQPAAGAIVGGRHLPRALTIDINFGVGQGTGTGASRATCLTAPSDGPATFTVKWHSGAGLVTVGTIVINTDGSVVFTATAVCAMAAGDLVYIEAPAVQDTDLADIFISLLAQK